MCTKEDLRRKYLSDDNLNLGIGQFQVTKAQPINILLVGRTKTGKTSLVETLINPQQALGQAGFSETKQPEFHSLNVTDLSQDDHPSPYQLNIIDTPGLWEVLPMGERSRSDAELLKLAKLCLERSVTQLHVVCFVSKVRETHTLDAIVFKQVMAALGSEFSEIAMLILTHCDGLEDKFIDNMEKDIATHPQTQPIYQYCKLGIHRYGVVDYPHLQSFDNEIHKKLVTKILGRTEVMRGNLIKSFIACANKAKTVAELQDIFHDTETVLNDRFMRVIQENYARENQGVPAQEDGAVAENPLKKCCIM